MAYFVDALVEGGSVRSIGYSASLKRRRRFHAWKYPCCRMLILGAYATREIGLDRERWWIKRLYEAGHPLRNIRDGGAGGVVGQKRSYLTRSRMSAGQKGRICSAATRIKLSEAAKRQFASWEMRARVSAALRDHPVLPKTRIKMSAAKIGRRHSEKHRANISAATKGKSKPWSQARWTAQERRQNGKAAKS